MKKFKTLVCMGIALILALTPISPISVSNPNSEMVVKAQAATVSKTCTATFSGDLAQCIFSSSKDVADVTKLSSTKYKITNLVAGTTTVKATMGNKTYKTAVKISVNSKGYPTLTFLADDDYKLKITSSDTSVISVSKTSNGDGTSKYTVKFKAVGTSTLKVSLKGVSCGSCKMKIS